MPAVLAFWVSLARLSFFRGPSVIGLHFLSLLRTRMWRRKLLVRVVPSTDLALLIEGFKYAFKSSIFIYLWCIQYHLSDIPLDAPKLNATFDSTANLEPSIKMTRSVPSVTHASSEPPSAPRGPGNFSFRRHQRRRHKKPFSSRKTRKTDISTHFCHIQHLKWHFVTRIKIFMRRRILSLK